MNEKEKKRKGMKKPEIQEKKRPPVSKANPNEKVNITMSSKKSMSSQKSRKKTNESDRRVKKGNENSHHIRKNRESR